jgi:hypothetical protein
MNLKILRASSIVLLLMGTSTLVYAQSISSQGTTGTSSTINPRGPGDLRDGQITNPNLRHTGLFEQWRSLAPKPQLFPTATKVVGKQKELYVALFNERYEKGSLIVSTLTFKLMKTDDGKVRNAKLQIAQVEENGKAKNILAADPPPFVLKNRGAQIPLSMEMKNGDYVVLKISIALDEAPVEFYLRLDAKGLSFAPAPSSPAREPDMKETMLKR